MPGLQGLDAWRAVLNWKATVMIRRGEVNYGLPPDPFLQNTEWSILLRVWLQPSHTRVCLKGLLEMWPDTFFFSFGKS